MLNRRQFVHAAAAVGATLLSRSATVRAHDLILRGKQVIDPSLRIDAVLDVAVAGAESRRSNQASRPMPSKSLTPPGNSWCLDSSTCILTMPKTSVVRGSAFPTG